MTDITTTVPYKLYKSTVNGIPTVSLLPGTNTPYGYSEINYADLGQVGKDYLDYYKNQIDLFKSRGYNQDYINNTAVKNYNDAGGDALYQSFASGQYDPVSLAKLFNLDATKLGTMATGGSIDSGLSQDANGNWGNWTQINADQAAHDAAVAAGTETKVPVGSGFGYVPTGSAGEKLATGIANGTVDPHNPQQQYAASMTGNNTNSPGIKPSDPGITPVGPDGKPIPSGVTPTDANGNPIPGSAGTAAAAGAGTPVSTGVGDNPIDHVNQIYQAVYDKLGLSSLKATIGDYNKQLLDLRNKKADDAANINNNPWLTEGVRVNQINKLEDKYGQKEANLLAYLQMSNSLYNSGVSEANAMITDVNQLEASNATHAQDLVDARYKLANNQPFYKYPGTALVYSTATGTGVSYDQYIALGGDPNFGNVAEIKPSNSADEHTLVMDLAKKYSDAHILPTDSLLIAQQKQAMSPTYLKSVKGTVKPPSSPSSPRSPSSPTSPTKTGITVSSPPKTASTNNIRTWLFANYHKYAGKAYYDIWGAAADALKAVGIDPSTPAIDKTFWDVFRPGEYDQYHKKTTSTSSSYDSIH